MTARRRLTQVFAWLLTPVVAWAASFLGGWIGAAVARGMTPVRGALWMGGIAAVAGVLAGAAWVAFVILVVMRRPE